MSFFDNIIKCKRRSLSLFYKIECFFLLKHERQIDMKKIDSKQV